MSAGLPLPSSPPIAGSPWGSAPTPLAPGAYRACYGGRRAARSLRSAAGRPDLMLYDLDGGFWEEAPWSTAPPIAFKSLRWQLAQLPPPPGVPVLHAGTPVEKLMALFLGTRVRNVVLRARQAEEIEGRLRRTLTTDDVLGIRGAGVMVLLELLAVVEGAGLDDPGAVLDGLGAGPDGLPRPAVLAGVDRRGDRLATGPDEPPDDRAVLPPQVPMPEPLADLLAVAREFRGAASLKDALEVDLGSLAARTGLATELSALRLDALQVGEGGEGRGHAARLLEEIETLQAELTPREKLIFDRRLFRRRPDTLEALGEQLGVTRERVRQLESRLKRRIDIPNRLARRVRIVAGAVADRIAPVARPEDVDRQLASVFDVGREDRGAQGQQSEQDPETDVHAGSCPPTLAATAPDCEGRGDASQTQVVAQKRRDAPTCGHGRREDQGEGRGHASVPLACRMIRNRLRYRAKGKLELDEQAAEAVDTLRQSAREQQDDAGLLDETALQSRLPDPSWTKHWELLIEACGFYRIDGLLGLRNTLKARVKAAVLNIGRLATREEIAARCGLTPERTSSYLSALPSVARADRTRWGLVEWIDDVYEGVANEIQQRIDEDDGATRVERVLDELPRLFGVSETTVRAYLNAPQFEVANGWVRRADVSALQLRPLDDAINGRDGQGRPWWSFQVKPEYFRGYSAAGLPPEIARELGCPPNGSVEVRLAEPSDCRPLSLIWRLTSLTGPSLGYLSRPLERLGAQPGDRVRLILCGDGSVELRRDDPRASPGDSDSGSRTADDILQRLKQRRQVL